MITNFSLRVAETPCVSVPSLQNFSKHMKKSVIRVPSEECQPLQQAIDMSLLRLVPAALSQQCNHFITVFTPPVLGVLAVPTSRVPYRGRACSACSSDRSLVPPWCRVLPLPSRRCCSGTAAPAAHGRNAASTLSAPARHPG